MMEKMDKKSPLALLARACETIGADSNYNSNNGKTSSDSNTQSSTPLASNGITSGKKLSTSSTSTKIHQPQKLNGHLYNQHHNHLHNGISTSNCHSPAQDTNSHEITSENNITPKINRKENGNNRKSPRETVNEMHTAFTCEPSTSSPSGAFNINGGMFNGLGSFPPGTNPANFMRPGPNGIPFPMPPGNAGQSLYPLNLMMAMAAAQQSQMMMSNPVMLQQLQHQQFAQMAQQQAVAAVAAAAAGKTAPHAAQTSTTTSASSAPIPATQQQQQQHRASTPSGQKKSNNGILNSSGNGHSASSSSNLTNNSQIGAHLAALAAATGVGGMDELAAAAFAQQQMNFFNAQYAAVTSSANGAGLPSSSETTAVVAAAGFPPINPFAMMNNGAGLDNLSLPNLSAAAPCNTFQAMVMAAACGQGRQICTYDVKGQICGKFIDGETDLIAHLKAHIVQNGGVIPSPKESIQNTKTNGGGKMKSSTKPQTSPQQQISHLGTPIPAHFPQQQLPTLPPQAPGSGNSLRYTPYARTSQQQHQQHQQQQQQTMAAIQQMHAAALQQTHQQQQQHQNQKQQSSGQPNQQNHAATGMLAMQYEQILAAMAGIPGATATSFPSMTQPYFFPPQSQAQAVTAQSAQLNNQRQQQQQQVQLNAHHQHQQMMHQQQLIMQHQQQQHQAAAVIAAAVGSGDK